MTPITDNSEKSPIADTDHEAKAREVARKVVDELSVAPLASEIPHIVSAIASALREAEAGERERCRVIAIAVQDRCSDEMNKFFADGRDEKAESYRCRLEGAAWVVQKLDASKSDV